MEDSLGRHGRRTRISRLKFRPTSLDNQATIACEAEHPALRATRERPARSMRADVLLSILFPPKKPEIKDR